MLNNIFAGFCLFIFAASHAQASTKTDQQRDDYVQLQQLLKKDKPSAKQRQTIDFQLSRLAQYPLYPYLQYTIIKKGLANRSLAEINSFLRKYKGLPFDQQFRLKALSRKYSVKNWHDVQQLYRAGDSVNYKCMYALALYKTGNKEKALNHINTIWNTGNSLPTNCDKMLKNWGSDGRKNSINILSRIELALVSRNHSLAKHLTKSLNKSAQAMVKSWVKLYHKPRLLAQDDYWKQRGHFANVMMKIALQRLIHQDVDIALSYASKISAHIGFTQTIKRDLINRLAVRAITKSQGDLGHWLTQLHWPTLNKSKQSQILRHLVGISEWGHINKLYQELWHSQTPDLEWQYWQAISLQKNGKKEPANNLLQKIAKHRRYYGFLASDKLNLPYSLNHQPLAVDKKLMSKLNKNAYLIRAHELYLLNDNHLARREWYQMTKRLQEKGRITAAQIAHQWGWHNRTIITLTMTDERDDLNLRFPMPHMESFDKESRHNEMDISWPLAIARQESAFMTRAKSHVGATGLMQLMPGTAKLQAKFSRVLYHRKSQLLSPAFNIKLGTGYLDRMLDKFDDNLAVAAAAYNAGPHRVKHWVNKELPQDQWIETIPYRETRNYVKNVLAYTVIYQHHLSQKSMMPNAAITPQRMSINNQ